jgi:hypothetical protein
MIWPNDESWKALVDGETVMCDEKETALSVVSCGDLVAPLGRLVVCDPFTGLQANNLQVASIVPGRYPMKVTMADVSGKLDGSHMREAYASLILSEAEEVTRRVIPLIEEGQPEPELAEGEFMGFVVDASTACFVDGGAVAQGMPGDESRWYDDIFENSSPDCWFNRMDDPSHIQPGLANVPLPLAEDGANIILIHSGWGDGIFPVVGGYDHAGNLARVHIDFNVM